MGIHAAASLHLITVGYIGPKPAASSGEANERTLSLAMAVHRRIRKAARNLLAHDRKHGQGIRARLRGRREGRRLARGPQAHRTDQRLAALAAAMRLAAIKSPKRKAPKGSSLAGLGPLRALGVESEAQEDADSFTSGKPIRLGECLPEKNLTSMPRRRLWRLSHLPRGGQSPKGQNKKPQKEVMLRGFDLRAG
jgi:hypothetical protein